MKDVTEKKTIDKSVRYISTDGYSHIEQTPTLPKEIKKNTSNTKLSQKDKKFIINKTVEGFRKTK